MSHIGLLFLAAVMMDCVGCFLVAWKGKCIGARAMAAVSSAAALAGAFLAARTEWALALALEPIALAGYFPDYPVEAMKIFRSFQSWTMLATEAMLLFFLWFLFSRWNEGKQVFRGFCGFVAAGAGILGIWEIAYGTAHLSKIFHIGYFLGWLAACEAATLLLPLGMRLAQFLEQREQEG